MTGEGQMRVCMCVCVCVCVCEEMVEMVGIVMMRRFLSFHVVMMRRISEVWRHGTACVCCLQNGTAREQQNREV